LEGTIQEAAGAISLITLFHWGHWLVGL